MEQTLSRLPLDVVTQLLYVGLVRLLRRGLATLDDMRLLVEIEDEMAVEVFKVILLAA